eukprot:COSAG01_NODE_781_length_13657_cov_12.763239_3_plen_118_part_00
MYAKLHYFMTIRWNSSSEHVRRLALSSILNLCRNESTVPPRIDLRWHEAASTDAPEVIVRLSTGQCCLLTMYHLALVGTHSLMQRDINAAHAELLATQAESARAAVQSDMTFSAGSV